MGVPECLCGSICLFLIRSALGPLCQHRGLLGSWLRSGLTSGRPWQETAGQEEGRGKGPSFPSLATVAPPPQQLAPPWLRLSLSSSPAGWPWRSALEALGSAVLLS